jgi:hypothetical protein
MPKMKTILEKLVQCDLWNCAVAGLTERLTPEFVQNQPGSYLHRFTWLLDDERIGELPIEWNWLPDEFGAKR